MNGDQDRPFRVCLFNSADPRGAKVGGIETYIRDYIFYHPQDMKLLFVGADEIGNLELGKISQVEFRGRFFDFLPLYHLSDSTNVYPNTIFQSETFLFASHLLRNWFKLRRVLREGNYSAELRRVEYAPIIWSMGVPFVQMVHVWGGKAQPMSGLTGKYWYLRTLTEFVAAALCQRFFSVNENMTAMYKKQYKRFARKFDTLTTWANTSIFKVTPYQDLRTLNIFFAGRMDKFKRPDIMFRVVEAVRKRSSYPIRFHYVGDGEPEDFSEFAAIADITTRHGRRSSHEIADILRSMHVGILTSEFEGMPRVVLETLSSGRPVVSLSLPQLEAVIYDGVNGFLIPRTPNHIEIQARRICEIFSMMQNGSIAPEIVAKSVEEFSPTVLLGKIFSEHRRLHELLIQSPAS